MTKYYSGDQIEKNGIGRACSKYGEEERCVQGFSGERDHLKIQSVNGNIKMDPQESGWAGAWTGLTWLRIGTGGGCDNEPSGSIKCREFLD